MLEILDPGLLTTVQDLGRLGFQKYGIGVGGAMDPFALRAANALVGNAPEQAALEITLSGLRLVAREKCLVAVTGAQFTLRVNEQTVPMNTALFLRAGALLELGERTFGARAYLALSGGIDVPLLLNSRSTDVRGSFGGMQGRALRAGDVLTARVLQAPVERAGKSLPEAFARYYENRAPLRVIGGPHDEYFSDAARGLFFSSEFIMGELSDRMALRLRGERIQREPGELLSCGVALGAIQIPPDGQPIILMADHQTTGGYPVIATVIGADIARLAQKLAGEKFSFAAVHLDEALGARAELERILAQIR